MSVRVIVDKRNRKVMLDLANHASVHDRAINQALHQIGDISVKYDRQILSEGPKTGRKYRNLPNQSSAPGEAPATQTGRLERSAGYKVRGSDQLEVGEEVEYAKYLENGTKGRMAPRPHLVVVANEKANDARIILEQAGRKGIKG